MVKYEDIFGNNYDKAVKDYNKCKNIVDSRRIIINDISKELMHRFMNKISYFFTIDKTIGLDNLKIAYKGSDTNAEINEKELLQNVKNPWESSWWGWAWGSGNLSSILTDEMISKLGLEKMQYYIERIYEERKKCNDDTKITIDNNIREINEIIDQNTTVAVSEFIGSLLTNSKFIHVIDKIKQIDKKFVEKYYTDLEDLKNAIIYIKKIDDNNEKLKLLTEEEKQEINKWGKCNYSSDKVKEFIKEINKMFNNNTSRDNIVDNFNKIYNEWKEYCEENQSIIEKLEQSYKNDKDNIDKLCSLYEKGIQYEDRELVNGKSMEYLIKSINRFKSKIQDINPSVNEKKQNSREDETYWNNLYYDSSSSTKYLEESNNVLAEGLKSVSNEYRNIIKKYDTAHNKFIFGRNKPTEHFIKKKLKELKELSNMAYKANLSKNPSTVEKLPEKTTNAILDTDACLESLDFMNYGLRFLSEIISCSFMSRLNEETYEKIYNDFLEKLKANAQSRNLSSIDEEDFASQMFLELYYKILKSTNYKSLLRNRTELQELERIRAADATKEKHSQKEYEEEDDDDEEFKEIENNFTSETETIESEEDDDEEFKESENEHTSNGKEVLAKREELLAKTVNEKNLIAKKMSKSQKLKDIHSLYKKLLEGYRSSKKT